MRGAGSCAGAVVRSAAPVHRTPPGPVPRSRKGEIAERVDAEKYAAGLGARQAEVDEARRKERARAGAGPART